MMLDEVFQLVQSTPHGSSGKGMSFYKLANECGRKSNLLALYPQKQQEADEDNVNPLRCGTFYHALMEHQLMGDSATWDMTDTMVTDIDWNEALRLYRAYNKDWGSAAQKWHAKVVGVEALLPHSEAVKAKVLELFGEEVTFRADWVGEIDESQIGAIYEETGLLLPSGGVYIFDHKTSKSRKDMHNWEFTFGNQSQAYLYLYNLEHPHAPAKGMIFDQIYRHEQISKKPLLTKTGTIRRDSSYQAFLAQPMDDAEKLIQNIVRAGKYNIENDIANPSACFSGYKPCHFFVNGSCSRY